MHHLQGQEFLESVEVAVVVEQGVILLDAERGDEAVDASSKSPTAATWAGGGYWI